MDYDALGKRIREIRILNNYTQSQVAEELHFSQKHLGNIERGSAHPSLECLVSIANTLQISTDYLLQDSLTPYKSNLSYEYKVIFSQFLEQQQISICNLQKKLGIPLTPDKKDE